MFGYSDPFWVKAKEDGEDLIVRGDQVVSVKAGDGLELKLELVSGQVVKWAGTTQQYGALAAKLGLGNQF